MGERELPRVLKVNLTTHIHVLWRRHKSYVDFVKQTQIAVKI